ncbi:MAG: CPBP family intramembrane metalloprotease [Sediminimonas qiaohouensis]|uniref:CPBP family intramembrane metalloprotease n=1 Tax=Sediminimonas qiaohouensis TaxID=552061 RepID=A0A7C9L8B6_9RHOB|nr:CPBP family intramembrane glutamic endopeptidase [Sediminimonas qiaohouensis]MTJ04514.1 CPBP family intramembrane metalloprotease [Sediminimonas qiaohouensis]
MSYRAHDAFVAPARPRSEVWRLCLGLVLMAVIVFGLGWAIQAFAMAILGDQAYLDFRSAITSARNPAGALYLLMSLGLLIIAAAMVANQLHGRGLLSLIGPIPRAMKQFRRVLAYLVTLYAIVWILPPSEFPVALEQATPLATWSQLLPLSLLAVFIQTSAEEIVFRGYLQQQLAARFNHPVIWITGPAVLFAALHYRPDIGSAGWLFMIWVGLFSVIASDITARAGTLGPAIALHFASNTAAILVVSGDPDLTGLALWRLQLDLSDPSILWSVMSVDLGMLVLAWLVARLALRR